MEYQLILPKSLQNRQPSDALNSPQKVREATLELQKSVQETFREYDQAKRASWVEAHYHVLG